MNLWSHTDVKILVSRHVFGRLLNNNYTHTMRHVNHFLVKDVNGPFWHQMQNFQIQIFSHIEKEVYAHLVGETKLLAMI